MGRSWTWDVARSSIETTDGNFDQMNFIQIAQKILGKFGSGIEVKGDVDMKPFKRVQVNPGERAYSFLARLAAYRDITLGACEGSSKNLRAIGEHSSDAGEQLIEGHNILSANCEIANEHVFNKYFANGQQAGDDKENMDDVSKQKAETGGSYPRYSPKISPSDLASEMYDVQKRLLFEKRWSEGTLISAQITVQGWLNSKNDLWRIVTYPLVKSPMLMLDQPLGIRLARFMQSRQSGTTTMLDCVVPWFLHGAVTWVGKDLLGKAPKDADVKPEN